MLDLRAALVFEDDGGSLVWGGSAETIAKRRNAQIERRGDRTIYHWGEHVVLCGLKLDLQTQYWNFGREAWRRSLRRVENWVIGDARVRSELLRIRSHMIERFGQPSKEQTEMRDEYHAEWQLHGARITIYSFEQHCLKLHVTIEQDRPRWNGFWSIFKRLTSA